MLSYFQAAGPVAWPLLALSLVSLTLILERVIFWLRHTRVRDQKQVDHFLELVERGDLSTAAEVAQGTKDPVLRTLHCGLVHREWSLSQAMAQQATDEVRLMKKHLTLFDTIINAAPLLGILGTIVGIIGAFQVLGGSGIPDPKAVTGGIAQALITTVFGLVIALYTLFPFNYFGRKVNLAREEIEKYATSLEIIFQKRIQEDQAKPAKKAIRRSPLDQQSAESLGGLSEKEKSFFLT
jgi:biopolymer transport protein ExbB